MGAGKFSRRGLNIWGLDIFLLGIVLILVSLGLVFLYSSTFGNLIEEGRSPLILVWQQSRAVLVGGIGMVFFAFIDYRLWKHLSLWIMGLSLLILVVTLFRPAVNNSHRYLLGQSIQSSEFAKLGFIIYFASWLSSRESELNDLNTGLLPFLFLLFLGTLLVVVEPDISTAVLIFLVSFFMFIIAGGRVARGVGYFLLLVFAGILLLALTVLLFGHLRYRLSIYWQEWMHPFAVTNPQVQGLLHSISDSWLGQGAGRSGSSEFILMKSDAAGAAVVVQFGLPGLIMLILLYLTLLWRVFDLMLTTPDRFGALLAAGVGLWWGWQTMVHLGVMVAMVPPTGVTLPFFSLGGSSMISCLAATGILLSISIRRGRNVVQNASSTYWGGDCWSCLSSFRRYRPVKAKRAGR